ncbi:hypothetical protein CR249_07730 (plasmid) [Ligilactobacillus salivarius]|nr:hypothetical protein CR249_07730 [Ligilactobacillus salivarius]
MLLIKNSEIMILLMKIGQLKKITNFDAVVMNPPYSHKWSANAGFKDDPRFAAYGVLPPKSKADYAFLLHGYYHLNIVG